MSVERQFDLAAELGAKEGLGAQRFTIYLPNRKGNKNKDKIENIEDYIQLAMYILARINGGVTRLPPGCGIWISDEEKEDIDVHRRSIEEMPIEETVLVYSILMNPERFKLRIDEIRRFLHKFGRETEQGAVWAEFFGESLDEDEEAFHARVFEIDQFEAPT